MNKIARLHFLTQDDIPNFSHLDQVKLACAAGVPWIQLRTKETDLETRMSLLSPCVDYCQKFSVTLVINDSVSDAQQLNSHGVHLGVDDGDPHEARQLLGPEKLLGLSSHNREEVLRGKQFRADYLGLGPYRFTTTKKNLSPILGPEELKKLIPLADGIPVIAIGGITAQDIPDIISAGFHGIAVSSVVNQALNPGQMLETLLKELDNSQLIPEGISF